MHDGRVPLFSFEGRAPQVSPQAWIAPTATLVGDDPVTEVGEGDTNPAIYRDLARRHAAGIKPVDG
jgi:hypothetical protein